MSCATRRAVLSDADAACEVVRRSIVDLCHADHHGDSETLAKWLANKTPANFERWIASKEHIALAAEIDGALVGFGLLNLQGKIAFYTSLPMRGFVVSARVCWRHWRRRLSRPASGSSASRVA